MSPGTPDIHPNMAEAYRRRIERLTEVPSHRDNALQAADAIREIIDLLMVTPGEKQGRCTVTIQGELGAILDRVGRSDKLGSKSERGLPAVRFERRRCEMSRFPVAYEGGAVLETSHWSYCWTNGRLT